MSKLQLDRTYKRGDNGKVVKAIQEWLCLHAVHVNIDKDFGPATERAVKLFQRKKMLPQTGVVNKQTYLRLTLPLAQALQPIPANGRNLSRMMVAYAQQHLRQHPREVGGQNRGPWVRLYMKGSEGNAFPWCAGFATYILGRACETLDVTPPLKYTMSCDNLAKDGKRKNTFVNNTRSRVTHTAIKPGSIFLVKKTEGDWIHTGIVLKAEEETFQTIEGNTNDEGSREGYEVCKRTRGYGKIDFVLIDGVTAVQPVKPKPKPKRPSSQKNDVKWLQRSLNTLMHTTLVVDGVAGKKTKDAVKRFQRRHGLAVDGVAGTQTKRKIRKLLEA